MSLKSTEPRVYDSSHSHCLSHKIPCIMHHFFLELRPEHDPQTAESYANRNICLFFFHISVLWETSTQIHTTCTLNRAPSNIQNFFRLKNPRTYRGWVPANVLKFVSVCFLNATTNPELSDFRWVFSWLLYNSSQPIYFIPYDQTITVTLRLPHPY